MVIQHTLLVFLIWSGVNLGSLSQAASAPTDFDSLKQEYCETPVSEQTIAKNFFSHFGVLHNDPEYYQDQIELGAPWQRTVVLNFNQNHRRSRWYEEGP